MLESVFQDAFLSVKSLVMRSNHLFPFFKYLHDRIFGGIQNVQVFLMKGLVKDANYPMTTLFIGREESAHQFAFLAYSQIEKMLSFGKILPCQIDPSRLPNIEAVLVSVGRTFAGKFLKQGCLLLPTVSFSLDLRRSMRNIIKRMSRRRRRDIKKLESLNYSYTISRNNEKDFDFFYWKMYLPYTKNRFGRTAHIKSYLESKAIYRGNGGIAFIGKEERPVVGILFQKRGKTLYALSFGVHEGDQNPVRDLAGTAALFFLIEWAKMKGIESLDYGASVPFLREGVFIYKKEWGMNVEYSDQSVCALKLNFLSEGSLSFLEQNPFILLDKGLIKGVVFVNHKPTKVELQQILSKYFLPKLDSLMVIAYYNSNTEAIYKSEFPPTFQNFSDALVESLLKICLLLRMRGFNVEVFEL